MDPMHEQQDSAPNAKVIAFAAAGAALLAGLLLALKRKREEEVPRNRAEAVVADVKSSAKKAAKAAKKKQKTVAAAADEKREQLAESARDVGSSAGFDIRTAERDLKAAAWDAQQEARAAESRLRAASHRVVDDATHLASRVGAEARNLAGEGRDRLAQLRQREEDEAGVERELARLREELDELRAQVRGGGRGERESFARAIWPGTRDKSSAQSMAAQAAAAAVAQAERSLRAKAPALLAAKNRAEMLEILQKEVGPTVRESAMQAAAAALGLWDGAKERGGEEMRASRQWSGETARRSREAARDVAEDVADARRDAADAARDAAEDLSAHVDERRPFLRGRFRSASENGNRDEPPAEDAEQVAEAATEESDEARRGKAGLLWGGAGLGLALYALLDPERRDKVLRFANEASVQVQELVRDMQGYDDEF
jgi:hypothetical protein